MIQCKKVPHDEVLLAIKNMEFSPEIIMAGKKVAIVMSQSWCPEWKLMNRYINTLCTHEDYKEEEIVIWTLIYDGTDYFDEFRNFKENSFQNYGIPYTRFYRDGKLVKTSNFLGKLDFIKSFSTVIKISP
jgi:hypothetical protein